MAYGASNTTNVPQILKSIWDDNVKDFQYEDAVFYALIEKDTTWDGISQIVTCKIGGQGGRSATFTDAKLTKAPGTFAKMDVQTSDDFAVWSVDHKLITLTRNKRGALVQALADATESAMQKFKRSTIRKLWGNGGGSIGKVASISTNTLTLLDTNDVRNFDLNDTVMFSTDDGYTATTGSLEGMRQVTAIDEDLGVITFDSTLATISGLAANGYVFHQGDYAVSLKGVPFYVTTSAPGVNGVPTTVWNMVRTVHPQRLAGRRFTGSQNQIQEEIMNALTAAFRANCATTHIFTTPEIFNEFAMSLEGQRRYADEKVGRVGFTGLEVTAQSGKTVKVFGDPSVRKHPVTNNPMVWGLNLDSWKLHTAEEYPMWLTADGEKKFLTEENANAREGRIGGYGQAYTNAPGDNWNLELT